MKKFITWVTLFLMSMVTTAVYAQQVPSDSILHVVAVQALKENKFVLEADRLMFKRGDVASIILRLQVLMASVASRWTEKCPASESRKARKEASPTVSACKVPAYLPKCSLR